MAKRAESPRKAENDRRKDRVFFDWPPTREDGPRDGKPFAKRLDLAGDALTFNRKDGKNR